MGKKEWSASLAQEEEDPSSFSGFWKGGGEKGVERIIE